MDRWFFALIPVADETSGSFLAILVASENESVIAKGLIHIAFTFQFACTDVSSLPATMSIEESGASFSGLGSPATLIDPASISSPAAADLQLTKSATGFKGPTHWTTVSNGMTDGNDQGYAQNATQPEAAFDDSPPLPEQNVLLFEGCKQVTDRELLNSLPQRREADSLVTLYFRAQEYRLRIAVIHPTEFLKRYNAFWDNHGVAPVSWLGLLYSIFCPTSQVQGQEFDLLKFQNDETGRSNTLSSQILSYREKVVQCLVRSHFAKGGPDIVETLVHYLLIESYLSKDYKLSVWLLMGNIVQIAIRMGYHRDPQNFKSLSPYQGFSTQMGLPSSIKQSLTDTMPPRNLQDRESDAVLTDLPPGRPINELTSSTVIIAKLHVATSMGAISDLVCAPRLLSYEDVVATNSRLDTMIATLPDSCQYRLISECLLDPPSVVSQVSFMFLC
ncbi:hypothetical protein N7493_000895 [Penicillium malachiteum]|uniref:Transcription factor domain-containing protein n=1 Tax=Penicillium malachiteum TaxID=1324776 RepID=A0AAD6HX70_9EURO|nr:hypothetical protein N7493_000895 [Penicillium malachiteum]